MISWFLFLFLSGGNEFCVLNEVLELLHRLFPLVNVTDFIG